MTVNKKRPIFVVYNNDYVEAFAFSNDEEFLEWVYDESGGDPLNKAYKFYRLGNPVEVSVGQVTIKDKK